MTIKSGSCGTGVTYRLEDDGTMYIEGSGAMTDYTSSTSMPWNENKSQILALIIGEGITHVGAYAFQGCTAMASVTFPSTLESIGNIDDNIHGAFYYCPAITELDFPDSLKIIGNGSFQNCGGLTSINLNKVTSIGKYAFNNCGKLIEANLGIVETCGTHVFHDCRNLVSVVLPNDWTSIPDYMFYSCYKLAEIDFPDTLTSIGYGAFYQCYALTTIDFKNVQTINDSAFVYCSGLTSLDLKNVVTIKGSAFQDCQKLTEIIIGAKVRLIDSYAFARSYRSSPSSSELIKRTYTFLGPKPSFGNMAIGYYSYRPSTSTYWNTDGSKAYTTGFASTNDYFYATCYARGFGDDITYTVENEVLRLTGSGDMWMFDSGCSLPKDVEGVTKVYIDANITVNMTTLTNAFKTVSLLSIPSLTTIPDSAFSSFTNLISIDISGAETIGASAFSNRPICSIKFGSRLRTIGETAFNGHRCPSIIVPASVTSIGANAFTPSISYWKHCVIVFRGKYISGTVTAPNGVMIHQFCASEPENDNANDYDGSKPNSSHPTMIRTKAGWKIIDTMLIDRTS